VIDAGSQAVLNIATEHDFRTHFKDVTKCSEPGYAKGVGGQ
jgi:hypothetical protein